MTSPTPPSTPIILSPEVADTARQVAELELAAQTMARFFHNQLEAYLRAETGIDVGNGNYTFDPTRGLVLERSLERASVTPEPSAADADPATN